MIISQEHFEKMMIPGSDLSALNAAILNVLNIELSGFGPRMYQLCRAAGTSGNIQAVDMVLSLTNNGKKGAAETVKSIIMRAAAAKGLTEIINHMAPMCDLDILSISLIDAAIKKNAVGVLTIMTHIPSRARKKNLLQIMELHNLDPSIFEIVYQNVDREDIRKAAQDIELRPGLFKQTETIELSMFTRRSKIDLNKEALDETLAPAMQSAQQERKLSKL